MPTPPVGPQADHLLACELAEASGALLLGVRAELGFDDATALREAGDRRSHELLMRRLAEARPDDAVLSEEGVDDAGRLSASRVWILDPLDGTREFGEPGRVDWAVHVALWVAGELVAGAVALPAQGRTYSTARAEPTPAATSRPMRIVVSRTRPPEFLQRVAEARGGELVPLGSAGAKVAAVIAGDADAYIHAGGQYEWDSAAPVAAARAAGLHASRIDGGDLLYNRPDPLLPDLVVCRAADAAGLVEAIAHAQLAALKAS
ncbi:MAG: 3'(2'),5'-bisphosphate nucleotidase CysQ [Mycobacteriales bacterium]|nr:MAG: 3'(2'),5'-bisphosphate nucleotidase CysQ [Pseudonocardiales bacterium]